MEGWLLKYVLMAQGSIWILRNARADWLCIWMSNSDLRLQVVRNWWNSILRFKVLFDCVYVIYFMIVLKILFWSIFRKNEEFSLRWGFNWLKNLLDGCLHIFYSPIMAEFIFLGWKCCVSSEELRDDLSICMWTWEKILLT